MAGGQIQKILPLSRFEFRNCEKLPRKSVNNRKWFRVFGEILILNIVHFAQFSLFSVIYEIFSLKQNLGFFRFFRNQNGIGILIVCGFLQRWLDPILLEFVYFCDEFVLVGLFWWCNNGAGTMVQFLVQLMQPKSIGG